MKPIYYILGGIAAYTIYQYARLAKTLSFNIQDVTVTGNVLKPVVNLFLKVSNPSSQSATIKSITGDVLINDQLVGTFQNFTSSFIPRNNFTVIKIETRPSLLGSINVIKSFILNKGKGIVNVQINGFANVDGNTINFSNNIKL
jgi:LEA14-like dessication related protein